MTTTASATAPSALATLAVSPRTALGRRPSLRLRADGKLPAVIYGMGQSVQHLTVPHDPLWAALDAGVRVFELALDEGAVPVLVKDLQYDALGERLVHADFLRIDLDQDIEVNVRVELIGEAAGVREGGVVTLLIADVPLITTPRNIPDAIRVPIAALALGEQWTLGRLTLPAGTRLADDADPDALVLFCRAIVEETTALPADFEAQPEVIGEREKAEAEEE